MTGVIKLDAQAEKKIFVNKESGESFPYYQVGVTINNQYIKLSIPKESKLILNYFLDQELIKSAK